MPPLADHHRSPAVEPAAWPTLASHRMWLSAHCRDLLRFGRDAAHPAGGAAYLDDHGQPDPDQPVHTWITARMVHVHSLGALLGVPGSRPRAAACLTGLQGLLRDDEHGGWFPSVDPATGRPGADGAKACYDHAFVLLAASSAWVAGIPGAGELLADAQQVFLDRFWDEATGRCVDTWDRTFSTLDTYRGINANMHSVEAMLAVGEATGDTAWYDRAARIASFVVETAGAHDWRIPEHYDAQWVPQPELNADRPADQFKPYGATIGHGLEWARLLLQVESVQTEADPEPEQLDDAGALLSAARHLFDRAVTDGWSVDGAPGFVYTTDWSGTPVVRDRMHWVVAEAISAASVLWARTGEGEYADLYALWWDYAHDHLIDAEHGSWFHELDTDNRPAGTVWPGKPDLYHAVQATLIPRLPVRPGLAVPIAEGALR
ncbi:AGE family epimerase/isomerase [Cellulomonas soli]|uniref:AGE family epimerase/isomerase n=1 Tax=Cellulomonas soli TaxID=931535 RepID=UPI003F8712EA